MGLKTECFNYARGTLGGNVLYYVISHQKVCLPLLTAVRSKQDWCDAMDGAKVRYYYSRSKPFRSILTAKALEHALLSVRKSWPSTPKAKHEELWISVIRRALRRRGRFYRSKKQRKARFLSMHWIVVREPESAHRLHCLSQHEPQRREVRTRLNFTRQAKTQA